MLNRLSLLRSCFCALAIANFAIAVTSAQANTQNAVEEQVIQQALAGPRQSILNVGVLNGFTYASQFGNGQNGIATALQHAETVLVDPAYGGTERYGSLTLPAVSNSTPIHLIDYRYGRQADQYSNWTSGFNTVYPSLLNTGVAAHFTSCSMHFLTGISAANGTTCSGIALAESAPGFSVGNPKLGPSAIPSGAPWSVGTAFRAEMLSYTSGIMGANGGKVTHTGVGDTINYFYAYANNGDTAASDEGVKALAADTAELPDPYLGTLISASTRGARTIKTKPLGGLQGQGQYIMDRDDRRKVSGHILQIGPGLVVPVNAVTIDATVEPSNAWGTLVANVAPPMVLTGSTFATPEVVSVKVLAGAFNTTGLICIASQFHECAIPTSVSVSAGVATLAIALRMPHLAGALVMQGGMAGTGLELTANTVSVNSQTLRYLQDVFGSTDGHTLQVGTFVLGGLSGMSRGEMNLGSLKLASVTSSDATVQATIASNDTLWNPQRLAGSSFTFTQTGDPALEVPCTGLAFDAKGSFSCTISGLRGVHHATQGRASLGNDGFNLWPMAETLDVQDYATNPVQVDGSFVLEPNVINFAPNDVIEQTHNRSAMYAAITANLDFQNPYGALGGASFKFSGHGIQGYSGGGSGMSYPALGSFLNMNPPSMYQGSGGNAWPTNILNLGGFNGAPYSDGISASPGPLASFIEINPSDMQRKDPNYQLHLFRVSAAHGSFRLFTVPSENSVTLYQAGGPVSVIADGNLTLRGSTVAVQGPLAAASGLTASAITDTALTPGQCVQATSGGLLKTTGAPCGASASGGMRFVGSIVTTGGTRDLLPIPAITTQNHCTAQATNQQAADLPEFLTVTAGTGVALNHAKPTPSATFDIFCNIP